jgi:hypothetical protein
MRSRISIFLACAVLLGAVSAVAQNAGPNTAGPTKNQLKLKLTEPREGAQISGTTIRVAVDYNKTIFGEGQGTRFGEKNFPMPVFNIFVDNALKQTINGTDSNVAVITDVPLGSHKVVVIVKNISGEIIDRAEVNVINVAEATASTSPSTSTSDTSASSAPAPPEPPSASSSSPSYAAPPPPAQTDTMPSASSSTLPKSASDAPETALLGLTLVAGGLWVARRMR